MGGDRFWTCRPNTTVRVNLPPGCPVPCGAGELSPTAWARQPGKALPARGGGLAGRCKVTDRSGQMEKEKRNPPDFCNTARRWNHVKCRRCPKLPVRMAGALPDAVGIPRSHLGHQADGSGTNQSQQSCCPPPCCFPCLWCKTATSNCRGRLVPWSNPNILRAGSRHCSRQ